MNAINVISPRHKNAAPKLVALGLLPMVLRWEGNPSAHRFMKTRCKTSAAARRHVRGITKINEGRWNSENSVNVR
jgi:hypothetical protein